jgi:hypothetical protein
VPDFPKVRVEISGPRRAGKSVLVAHFQRVLCELLIGFDGPADLPRRSFVDLAGAVNNLRKRGLEVEFVETQTGELEQIDATVGFGGRP